MKQIIKGKMYNTDTAEKIGDIEHSNRRDFGYYEETLYRKKTGEFFLYGHGGPATKYGYYVDGNTRSGGEGFIPLAIDEAREWVERHCDVDKYIEVFGEVEE